MQSLKQKIAPGMGPFQSFFFQTLIGVETETLAQLSSITLATKPEEIVGMYQETQVIRSSKSMSTTHRALIKRAPYNHLPQPRATANIQHPVLGGGIQ